MEELGTSTQSNFLPSGFWFLGFLFFLGLDPCGLVPPPPLEWNSILPLVTAELITPKGASRRKGVLGALVLRKGVLGAVAVVVKEY